MKSMAKDWAITIAIALAIAAFVHRFLFFFAVVPSPSMHPTIKVNEKIFVTRVYDFSNYKRGDIALFNSKELNKVLVKRIIGLPGDKIQIKNSKVYINGNNIEEAYVSSFDFKTYFDGQTITVPEDHYLFLGDNRAESYDSRYWKEPFISEADIIGKARFVLFPFKEVRELR